MTIWVSLFAVAMWVAIMRSPDTPIARAVWRATVTTPVAWAGRQRRGDVIVTLTLAILAIVLLSWVGREATQLLAMSAPDVGIWLTTFEIGAYVDAFAGIALAASTIRMRPIGSRVSARFVSTGDIARRRTVRARRRRQVTPPTNDEDGYWSEPRWHCAA